MAKSKGKKIAVISGIVVLALLIVAVIIIFGVTKQTWIPNVGGAPFQQNLTYGSERAVAESTMEFGTYQSPPFPFSEDDLNDDYGDCCYQIHMWDNHASFTGDSMGLSIRTYARTLRDTVDAGRTITLLLTDKDIHMEYVESIEFDYDATTSVEGIPWGYTTPTTLVAVVLYSDLRHIDILEVTGQNINEQGHISITRNPEGTFNVNGATLYIPEDTLYELLIFADSSPGASYNLYSGFANITAEITLDNIVMEIDEPECQLSETRCEGTDYFNCEDGLWFNNGATIGHCGVECITISDCDTSYNCEDYLCVLTQECTTNADCDTGYECINEECVLIGDDDDDEEEEEEEEPPSIEPPSFPWGWTITGLIIAILLITGVIIYVIRFRRKR